MDELRRVWGQNIKSKRLRKEWSQADLADRLKPSVRASSVCRWEQGLAAPTDDHKVAIAELFDEDVHAMFPLVRVA